MSELNPNKWGAVVDCKVCGLPKAPRGRSVPMAAHGGFCTDECRGYSEDPQVGSLWPLESEADFGYPVGNVGTIIKLKDRSGV